MSTEVATNTSTTGRRLTVSLVNDYEIVVRGLAAMLDDFCNRIEVVELEIDDIPDRRADIALFDTFATRREAVARASRMLRSRRVDHVVLYTWSASPGLIDDATAAGVSGVVLKSVPGEELVDALERVAGGERIGLTPRHARADEPLVAGLTPRELEVAALLASGLSNRAIAEELYLSVDTVKTYVRRAYSKLAVHNRAEAAVKVMNLGLTPNTVG